VQSLHCRVGDSVRIRHLRFSMITHASVSRARQARLTAFVTQSGDVFNEDARLTIESSAKTPAVVVGRSRGRVAQRRERVSRRAPDGSRTNRPNNALQQCTTPRTFLRRRGGGCGIPAPRASPTATSEYCWFTASIHRNLPLDRRHARVKA